MSEPKPREWWIAEATEHTDERVISSHMASMMFGGDDFWKSEYIQVVEHEAYAALSEKLKAVEAAYEAAIKNARDCENEMCSDLATEREKSARLIHLLKQYHTLKGSPGYAEAVTSEIAAHAKEESVQGARTPVEQGIASAIMALKPHLIGTEEFERTIERIAFMLKSSEAAK